MGLWRRRPGNSKATMVAIIAHEIALLLTYPGNLGIRAGFEPGHLSLNEKLYFSHMEVAFGYCKLLPVFGKKQLEKEHFHCHPDIRAGSSEWKSHNSGGQCWEAGGRKRTFLSSLFLHTFFFSVAWRRAVWRAPPGIGFFLMAGSSASSP